MPRLCPIEDTADRKLVRGLNEGDETALAALYDEYAERVYDYVLSMCGDEKVAAGIVHDTFIDAGRRAPRMRDHLHLSSWLYGAARRRCLRRGRARHLYWDRDGVFSPNPFLSTSDDTSEWPPSGELHEVLRAALVRLEPLDQEVALLAFRHGLPPARLGGALGLSSRRAALRVRKARSCLAEALRAEVARAAHTCGGVAPVAGERDAGHHGPLSGALWATLHRRGELPPPEPSGLDRHIADCAECRSRVRVDPVALLRSAPAPVLPAALRHRVMHTATDPELAGHRADIAARGGSLTPEGLPSQPDVPSPFTRRWLFAGGGMAGALVAALVAVLIIGPGLDGTLSLPPFRTHPQPSVTDTPRDGSSGARSPQAPQPGGPGRSGVPPARPQTEGTPTAPSTTTRPSVPPSSPPSSPLVRPPRPGRLVIAPAKVELWGTKTGRVTLQAESGPVTWTAMTSTSQLILSEMQGGVPKGGSIDLTITLRTAIVGLPGQGTITFTDSEGALHKVTVVWGVTLL
ncbi:sigma-70 family RNA polymerase sigma factor [Spirillospora albida]|uniref:sigma-70 family RNA polymerase sigma factor n=1 Tax=Spirillospora albida TaxID=58123 RepID=UPI00056ACA20|nr:sigma-70 family RNA polymerase sigma factor [Spirillospora albida]